MEPGKENCCAGRLVVQTQVVGDPVLVLLALVAGVWWAWNSRQEAKKKYTARKSGQTDSV